MSYDLVFWRQERPLDDDAQSIYERLCEDEDIDGLAVLPLADIKRRFAELFPGIEDDGAELNWEGDEGAMQVAWTPDPIRHVHVTLYGCSGDEAERVVRIAHEFGCPVYDPQAGETYEPGG